MTNEEKAQQIIGCNRVNCLECGGSLSVANGCTEFERIIAMAEWKDEQYNEEKRDLLGLVKMLKIDEHNQTIIEDLVAILNS